MSGNAFGLLDSVKKEELPFICKSLEELLGIPVETNLLGSTGKKDVSGDIDVAVDETIISVEDFIVKLESNFPEVRRHGGQNSWSVPYTIGEKTYQVDFMYGNIEWLKFYFYSGSPSETNFKGAHRNLAIVGLIQDKLQERSEELDSNGIPIEVTRYILSPVRGLCRVNRKRVKNAKGTWKEIETEISKTIVPSEIATLLGSGSVDELNTLESVIGVIDTYPDTTEVYRNIARNFMNARLLAGYKFPEQLKGFYNEQLR